MSASSHGTMATNTKSPKLRGGNAELNRTADSNHGQDFLSWAMGASQIASQCANVTQMSHIVVRCDDQPATGASGKFGNGGIPKPECARRVPVSEDQMRQ